MKKADRIPDEVLLALAEEDCPWGNWDFCRNPDGSLKILGTGACGMVYEICEKDRPNARHRALKILPEKRQGQNREAEVQMQLRKKSDHIVKIFDSGRFAAAGAASDAEETGNGKSGAKKHYRYISMELLHPVLNSAGQIYPGRLAAGDEDEILRLAEDIAEALKTAHDYWDADLKKQGLIHGDVKLENLFRGYGSFRLGDFGLAGNEDASETQHSGQMTVRGTKAYGAPELLEGRKWNAKTDMYAYGIVLYVLMNRLCFPLCEKPLYEGLTYDILKRRCEMNTLPLPECGPEELRKLAVKLCRKNPKDRCADMGEVLDTVRQIRRRRRLIAEEGSADRLSVRRQVEFPAGGMRMFPKEMIGPQEDCSRETEECIYDNDLIISDEWVAGDMPDGADDSDNPDPDGKESGGDADVDAFDGEEPGNDIDEDDSDVEESDEGGGDDKAQY